MVRLIEDEIRGKVRKLHLLRQMRARCQRGFLPWLGELVVRASTKRAEKMPAASGPISVLVDVTVLRHAVTHETAWASAALDAIGPMDGPGYAARVRCMIPGRTQTIIATSI
jgi:hypothetical protein